MSCFPNLRLSNAHQCTTHSLASEKGRSTERKCSFLISLYVGKKLLTAWQGFISHKKIWATYKHYTIQRAKIHDQTSPLNQWPTSHASTFSGCMQEKPMIYQTKRTLKLKGMNFQELLYAHDAYADNTLTVAKKTKTQIRTCIAWCPGLSFPFYTKWQLRTPPSVLSSLL